MLQSFRFGFLFLVCTQSWSQALPQDSLFRKRLSRLLTLESISFVGGISYLSASWYAEKKAGFRFHNDNNAWQGIDKLGHLYTNFQLCKLQHEALMQTGISAKKALPYAALSSWIATTSIEILDGTQPEYGFSWGDMAANSLGIGLFWFSQQNRPHYLLKWSFHPTELASQNPTLLGKNLGQQWLKDYNGQTYWLSFSLGELFPRWRLPAFLGIAVGYGGYNMIHGQQSQSIQAGYEPYSIYYLSLDFHLSKIPTHSPLLRRIFKTFDLVKFPAPTLAFSAGRGLTGHVLFF